MVKAGGEPRAGPRFRVRRVRCGSAQGRARADLGAAASDRPLRVRHARRRLSLLSPARPRPGLIHGAGGPRGSRRARRGNKWARMPYEISKCRAGGPRVGARAACPLGQRPSRGVGGSAGVHGRGGGARARAHERPAALGGDPGPGTPKVGGAGRACGAPSPPTGLAGDRGPGSRTVPGAPSKWRPALRVEATGDRLRPVLSPRSPPLCPRPGGVPGRGAPNVRRCVCVSAEKVFASLPQVERGVSKIIGGDPKGNNFIYTNGKCVILRNIDVSTPAPCPPPAARPVPTQRSSGVDSPSPPAGSSPALWPGRRTPRPLSAGTTPQKPGKTVSSLSRPGSLSSCGN